MKNKFLVIIIAIAMGSWVVQNIPAEYFAVIIGLAVILQTVPRLMQAHIIRQELSYLDTFTVKKALRSLVRIETSLSAGTSPFVRIQTTFSKMYCTGARVLCDDIMSSMTRARFDIAQLAKTTLGQERGILLILVNKLISVYHDLCELDRKMQVYHGVETLSVSKQASEQLLESLKMIRDEAKYTVNYIESITATGTQKAVAAEKQREQMYKNLQNELKLASMYTRRCLNAPLKNKLNVLVRGLSSYIDTPAKHRDDFSRRLAEEYLPTLNRSLAALERTDSNNTEAVGNLLALSNKMVEIIYSTLESMNSDAEDAEVRALTAEVEALKNLAVLKGDIDTCGLAASAS